MKKSDLECGNVAEARNGRKYFVYHSCTGKALTSLITGWCVALDKYNENLIYTDSYIDFDIMKVYKDFTCKELLWERKEEKPKPKPKLTEDEKVILRNLPKDYKWIARDKSDWIFLYKKEPIKCKISWSGSMYTTLPLGHLFQFIKWEDDEPYSIEDLLKGEENEKEN